MALMARREAGVGWRTQPTMMSYERQGRKWGPSEPCEVHRILSGPPATLFTPLLPPHRGGPRPLVSLSTACESSEQE